jgi:hypothetical protein
MLLNFEVKLEKNLVFKISVSHFNDNIELEFKEFISS